MLTLVLNRPVDGHTHTHRRTHCPPVATQGSCYVYVRIMCCDKAAIRKCLMCACGLLQTGQLLRLLYTGPAGNKQETRPNGFFRCTGNASWMRELICYINRKRKLIDVLVCALILERLCPSRGQRMTDVHEECYERKHLGFMGCQWLWISC